jgi:predicted MFS family arabinose efflux permease
LQQKADVVPDPPASIWTRNVLILALTVFFARFGQGLQGGVSTNFLVHDLGLGGDQVLWLAGVREIPGLGLMFLTALIMRLPQSHRAFWSLLLMGFGYGCYYFINSYTTLLALAFIASIGFHNWMPLLSSLGMGLVGRERSGRVLGRMNAVGSLASMGGMVIIVFFSEKFGLRPFFLFGGAFLILAALVVSRLPKEIGASTEKIPRLLLRKRYWLFYVLTFFEGSRTQVFYTFGAWVLVDSYGFNAQRISVLLIISGLMNFLIAPHMGNWIDRFGERITLTASYFALVLVFIAYATVHNAYALGGLYIAINFLVMFRIGLHTYVNRIAPDEDLSPTLSAGVSINHLTSVGMSLVAGTLLRVVGYEGLCWGAAGVILLSIPFALAIRVDKSDEQVSEAAVA